MIKLEAFQKAIEKKVPGSKFKPVTGRLPFGIFDLDLALGGGIPESKVTQIFGKESGGKTLHALKLAATYQALNPDRYVGWVDIEQTHDEAWAQAVGVDLGRLVVYQPATAEEAIDITSSMAQVDEVGLLVADSMAAMVSTKVVESDSSYTEVGKSTIAIQTLAKKLVNAQAVRARQGNNLTVLLLNQMRVNIGQMFGNPEHAPGGKYLRHCCSLILRSFGKKVVSKEIDPQIPSFLDISMTVMKHKMKILGESAKYQMPINPKVPGGVGHVVSARKILNLGKMVGFVTNDDGWECYGVHFDKQDQFLTALEQDADFRRQCEAQGFAALLEQYNT